jgi:hypothetical protein
LSIGTRLRGDYNPLFIDRVGCTLMDAGIKSRRCS